MNGHSGTQYGTCASLQMHTLLHCSCSSLDNDVLPSQLSYTSTVYATGNYSSNASKSIVLRLAVCFVFNCKREQKKRINLFNHMS